MVSPFAAIYQNHPSYTRSVLVPMTRWIAAEYSVASHNSYGVHSVGHRGTDANATSSPSPCELVNGHTSLVDWVSSWPTAGNGLTGGRTAGASGPQQGSDPDPHVHHLHEADQS